MTVHPDSECQASWVKYGEDRLLGRKIVRVRFLSVEEREEAGWSCRPVVIHLDDGTYLYPSRDDEGNDGGALFGESPDGEGLAFPVL